MKVKDYLYIGIIGLLMLLYFFKPSKSKEVEILKSENSKLFQDIQSKVDTISLLSKQQEDYRKQVSDLERDYKKNSIQYITNDKEHYIKDSVINTFSVSQFEQFFTDRYKTSH